MNQLLKNIYTRLASLTLGIWLLGGTMFFLAIGSFLQGEGSTINEMPLLLWLREVPNTAAFFWAAPAKGWI